MDHGRECREIEDRKTGLFLQCIRNLERGNIRMVAMPGPSAFVLPDLISRFAAQHEDVMFSLFSRSSEQVQRLVSVQQYDIGLADIGFPNVEQSPLVDHDILEFDCVCAMRAGDALAEKDVITPRDLDGKPMATLFKSHPTYQQTEAAFSGAGAELRVRFESQYFIPMFAYVEHGLAYGIVDPLSAKSHELYKDGPGKIAFRPFAPKVRLVASIMTPAHRAPSNLVQAFTGVIRRELKDCGHQFQQG